VAEHFLDRAVSLIGSRKFCLARAKPGMTMHDSERSVRLRQFQTCLLILAPLLLGFSLVGVIDGDIVEAIIWAVVVVIAIGCLLVHRTSSKPSQSGHARSS